MMTSLGALFRSTFPAVIRADVSSSWAGAGPGSVTRRRAPPALSQRVERDVRERFASLVFDTVIRRTVKLAEAPKEGCSILGYAPRSAAAAEYRALAREVLENLGEPVP